jgi:endogenous inhibitor of DNA gyrase (YacG/DUF329 family)
MPSCPICSRAAKPRAANPAFPFCSDRCKTIDLGKWMSEEYRIAAEQEHERDAGEEPEDESGPSEPDPVRH